MHSGAPGTALAVAAGGPLPATGDPAALVTSVVPDEHPATAPATASTIPAPSRRLTQSP